MRLALAAALGASALAACSPAGREGLSRNAAESVIGRTIATRFPGVPVEPATNCLIAGATRAELLGLASDTVTGPTTATTETILIIARRPAIRQCLAAGGAAAFPT